MNNARHHHLGVLDQQEIQLRIERCFAAVFIRASAAALIFASALAAPSAADTSRIAEICKIASLYEAERGDDFLEEFDRMLFSRHGCLEGESESCPLAYLRRVQGSFDIAIPKQRSWAEAGEKLSGLLQAFQATAQMIAPRIGADPERIDFVTDVFKADDPVVTMMIGAADEIISMAVELDQSRPDVDLGFERDARLMANGPFNCWSMTLEYRGAPGSVLMGFGFVDIDLPLEAAASCVKNNLFNIFVQGAPPNPENVVDAPWRPLADPAPGKHFSASEMAILSLAYQPPMKPGMSRAAARAEAARILAGCPE